MKYTLTRNLNALAAGMSFLEGIFSKKVTVHGMPPAVGIELTNFCNLNCPECSSGSGMMTRQRGFMSDELFDKIIIELRPFIYNLNLYFQGESMLHPHFFTLLDKCNGIHTTLSTNGHFLTAENSQKIAGSGLKKIIISLDGMDSETYSLYRVNGDFRSVMEGIENICSARQKAGSDLKIVIQFLVNRYNESQISAVRKFAAGMKVSLSLKSMQIINSRSHETWVPADDKFSRYRKTNGRFEIKGNLKNRCARLWFNPVITWDGKILPCCFDKDAGYVMGDINKESFRQVWNGPEYRQFRRSLLNDRLSIPICGNCTGGL